MAIGVFKKEDKIYKPITLPKLMEDAKGNVYLVTSPSHHRIKLFLLRSAGDRILGQTATYTTVPNWLNDFRGSLELYNLEN